MRFLAPFCSMLLCTAVTVASPPLQRYNDPGVHHPQGRDGAYPNSSSSSEVPSTSSCGISMVIHTFTDFLNTSPFLAAHLISTTTDTTMATSETTTPTTATSTRATSTIMTTAAVVATGLLANNSQKYVFAHHMVGNTYPYTIENWKTDISLALAYGIDGFALNVGSDSWVGDRVADAYEAAKQLGASFKLFISLDMRVLPCSNSSDATALRAYVANYSSHSNQLIYKNRVYISTFSGESCTFGQDSVASGWSSQFTKHPSLTGANAVYFIPSFFVDPSAFSAYNGVMDGALNWNSAWPISLTKNSSLPSTLSSPVSDSAAAVMNGSASDVIYISGLKNMSNSADKGYLPAVSPWFFTHYGVNSYNKSWIYYADQHMYARRWQALVESRDMFDIIEVVSWNDYGESSYIGPIEGAQPNSQTWVDGFDHTAWLDVTNYYAEAFKTGSWPTITKDKIYMWSRPHPRDASAPDSVGKPDNYQMTVDAVWALVMATSAGQVTLQTSSSNSQTFNVVAGVNKLAISISSGGTMAAKLVRNGETVVELSPTFTFNGSPSTYNYNAFVAASS